MFDAIKSRQIYQQLMNGKVINKYILANDATMQENDLFTEILREEDAYKQQYLMSGYLLDIREDFVLIRELERQNDSLKTDATLKIYILLLLIAKYINDNNYRLDKLTSPDKGLHVADIESISVMTYTKEILEKADLKKDLLSHIKSSLVDRGILLEKASSTSYILSNAGLAFFREVKEQFYE